MKRLIQKTSSTDMAQNIGKRNFFQKTVILLAILAFTSFGFKAKAQTYYTVTVNNNAPTGCDWTIRLVDANSNVVGTLNSSGGGSTVYSICTLNVDNIAIVYNSGGCQGYTFGSLGSFPYTSVTPACTPPAVSCSSSIDCQGVAAISNCGATPNIGDIVVTININ